MSRRRALLLALALPGLDGTAAADAAGDMYRRAMSRAIETARDELVESRDLFADHSTWEDPWIVESEHYSVRATASRYLAAKIARDLEYMLGQFQSILGTDHVPRARYPIWILPSLQEYNNVGGNAAEHSSFYGSFLATQQPGVPVVTYAIPNETLLGMWVTHTALHQFVGDAFGTAPPTWIDEGLASYFSLYWDWSWGARELKAIIDERRYVRLSHLTSADLSAFASGSHERLIVLGMFFKFLLHHQVDTRLRPDAEEPSPTSFAAYLRDVVRGRRPDPEGFAGLLANELDLLEGEFRGYDFGG